MSRHREIRQIVEICTKGFTAETGGADAAAVLLGYSQRGCVLSLVISGGAIQWI